MSAEELLLSGCAENAHPESDNIDIGAPEPPASKAKKRYTNEEQDAIVDAFCEVIVAPCC